MCIYIFMHVKVWVIWCNVIYRIVLSYDFHVIFRSTSCVCVRACACLCSAETKVMGYAGCG